MVMYGDRSKSISRNVRGVETSPKLRVPCLLGVLHNKDHRIWAPYWRPLFEMTIYGGFRSLHPLNPEPYILSLNPKV